MDKIISMVEGYKYLHFIDYCLTHKKYQLLEDTLGYTVTQLLKRIPNYIKYQLQDYELYKQIGKVIETGEPLLISPHDIDLTAYVKGLDERNQLVWREFNTLEFFNFMDGLKVIDFGCGSGFYSEIFMDVGATCYMYDRPDIAKVVKDYKPHLTVHTELPTIAEYDVIWLSEVLHGKSAKDRERLLNSLVSSMQKGGKLAVNELKMYTSLSRMFEWQMRIHCKGELLTPESIIDECILAGLRLSDLYEGPYHDVMIFTKGE